MLAEDSSAAGLVDVAEHLLVPPSNVSWCAQSAVLLMPAPVCFEPLWRQSAPLTCTLLGPGSTTLCPQCRLCKPFCCSPWPDLDSMRGKVLFALIIDSGEQVALATCLAHACRLNFEGQLAACTTPLPIVELARLPPCAHGAEEQAAVYEELHPPGAPEGTLFWPVSSLGFEAPWPAVFYNAALSLGPEEAKAAGAAPGEMPSNISAYVSRQRDDGGSLRACAGADGHSCMPLAAVEGRAGPGRMLNCRCMPALAVCRLRSGWRRSTCGPVRASLCGHGPTKTRVGPRPLVHCNASSLSCPGCRLMLACELNNGMAGALPLADPCPCSRGTAQLHRTPRRAAGLGRPADPDGLCPPPLDPLPFHLPSECWLQRQGRTSHLLALR